MKTVYKLHREPLEAFEQKFRFSKILESLGKSQERIRVCERVKLEKSSKLKITNVYNFHHKYFTECFLTFKGRLLKKLLNEWVASNSNLQLGLSLCGPTGNFTLSSPGKFLSTTFALPVIWFGLPVGDPTLPALTTFMIPFISVSMTNKIKQMT